MIRGNDLLRMYPVDDTHTFFGKIKIKGVCVRVARHIGIKVDASLYYNMHDKKYFLVKTYASEKMHIDFFNKQVEIKNYSTYEPDITESNFLGEYKKEKHILLTYNQKYKLYKLDTYMPDGQLYEMSLKSTMDIT